MRRYVVLAVLLVSSLQPAESQEFTKSAPAITTTLVSGGARPAPVPDQYGYPALAVDRPHLIDLLRKGAFQELEQLFDELAEDTRGDIRHEEKLVASYRSFFGSDTGLAGRFDEWVQRSPDSEIPLLARAEFLRARAWEARGEGYLRRKDRRRAETMQDYLNAGLSDVTRAAFLAPTNLAVYSTWLGLLFPRGWSETSARVLEQALLQYPSSYWLRFQALAGMTPRWGGDYESMSRLVEEAQRHVGINPRLGSLQGAVPIDQANEEYLAKDYEEALSRLEQAARYAPGWRLHDIRGRTFYRTEDYVRALASFDSAVALHPVSASVLEYRGRTLARIAEHIAAPGERADLLGNAATDLVESVRFSQPDSALAVWAGWTSRKWQECSTSPTTCFERAPPVTPETWEGTWWQRILLLIVSIPATLFMVLVEGHKLFLSPAPLLALCYCGWSFLQWRKQRYWTPRIIPIMSGLCFLTLVAINVDWVRHGGTMWTQRYVVIVVAALVPYLMYLVLMGPTYMRYKRPHDDPLAQRDRPPVR